MEEDKKKNTRGGEEVTTVWQRFRAHSPSACRRATIRVDSKLHTVRVDVSSNRSKAIWKARLVWNKIAGSVAGTFNDTIVEV